MQTAYKLQHRPTGNVLRTPFAGESLALVFLLTHLPWHADDCTVIQVQMPDESDVTAEALRILEAGPSGWSMILDDGFVGCAGCRTGVYEHKIESHAKTCLPLRDQAHEALTAVTLARGEEGRSDA